MASKNSVKIYLPNSFYHIYNRGVDKKDIFHDKQDYAVFLSYLKTYLNPKDILGLQSIILSKETSRQEKDHALKELRLKNYAGEVELIVYALMPNHFHLLIKQNTVVMDAFMNSLGTRYSIYYNRKYKRTGVLFQDVYKAVLLETEEQLLHLSRYIHMNPFKFLNIPIKQWSQITFPFSLPEYLGARNTLWIKSSFVLDYFSKSNPTNSYQSFLGFENDYSLLSQIALDLDSD